MRKLKNITTSCLIVLSLSGCWRKEYPDKYYHVGPQGYWDRHPNIESYRNQQLEYSYRNSSDTGILELKKKYPKYDFSHVDKAIRAEKL